MEPWALVGVIAATSALVGVVLVAAKWLVGVGESLGASPIPGLQAELEFTKERLESARLALAAEVQAAEARAAGAYEDFAKDRALRDALLDPDDGSRWERVLHAYASSGGPAPAGEPPHEASAEPGAGGDPDAHGGLAD